MSGIKETRVGYTGGGTAEPTYRSVCTGDGHTEAIQITFDPEVISYEELLGAFYKQHSPSASKAQYKSAIWYTNDKQKRIAEKVIASQGERAQRYTDLLPAQTWHDAENYHQQYIEKRGLIR